MYDFNMPKWLHHLNVFWGGADYQSFDCWTMNDSMYILCLLKEWVLVCGQYLLCLKLKYQIRKWGQKFAEVLSLVKPGLKYKAEILISSWGNGSNIESTTPYWNSCLQAPLDWAIFFLFISMSPEFNLVPDTEYHPINKHMSSIK